MFLDGLKALQYLHDEAKICHRDVKPMNLMIDNVGVCKVGDFGRAKEFVVKRSAETGEIEEIDTRIEGTEGTYSFFAPEMCALDASNNALTIYGDKHDVWYEI